MNSEGALSLSVAGSLKSKQIRRGVGGGGDHESKGKGGGGFPKSFYRDHTRRRSGGSDFEGNGGRASESATRRMQSGDGITEWEGGGRLIRKEIQTGKH